MSTDVLSDGRPQNGPRPVRLHYGIGYAFIFLIYIFFSLVIKIPFGRVRGRGYTALSRLLYTLEFKIADQISRFA